MLTKVVLSLHDLDSYTKLNKTLHTIFQQLCQIWPSHKLRITSIDRTIEEDKALNASGIHAAGPPWRAIDIGIHELEADLERSQGVANELCAQINKVWAYDPSRSHLTVAYCKPHGSGPHLHLQVHTRTKLRDSLRAQDIV
jgi:hypothetical protein